MMKNKKQNSEKKVEIQKNNPLHGVSLANIMEMLVEEKGWEDLACQINVRCFQFDPSIKSSLKFLRKTPWARKKVEDYYLRVIKSI